MNNTNTNKNDNYNKIIKDILYSGHSLLLLFKKSYNVCIAHIKKNI